MKYINLQMAQVIIFALKYILYLIYCRGILCNVVACLSSGMQPIKDDQFERAVEELETLCWQRVQQVIKKEEGLGLEYDESVICDVCRSVSETFKYIDI